MSSTKTRPSQANASCEPEVRPTAATGVRDAWSISSEVAPAHVKKMRSLDKREPIPWKRKRLWPWEILEGSAGKLRRAGAAPASKKRRRSSLDCDLAPAISTFGSMRASLETAAARPPQPVPSAAVSLCLLAARRMRALSRPVSPQPNAPRSGGRSHVASRTASGGRRA